MSNPIFGAVDAQDIEFPAEFPSRQMGVIIEYVSGNEKDKRKLFLASWIILGYIGHISLESPSMISAMPEPKDKEEKIKTLQMCQTNLSIPSWLKPILLELIKKLLEL